jgi:hypothetical protein
MPGDSKVSVVLEGGGDWIPDLDDGGTGMMTLEIMLMLRKAHQSPVGLAKEWAADFKLHAPYRSIIQGRKREDHGFACDSQFQSQGYCRGWKEFPHRFTVTQRPRAGYALSESGCTLTGVRRGLYCDSIMTTLP